MKVQITGVRVYQTQNEKYQGYRAPKGSDLPIYSIGLLGCPEFAGKTVTVTVEVEG